jgi:hypothetical protein
MEIKFEKYRENLTQVGNNIYSYYTRVATIEGNDLIQHKNLLQENGRWSVTTQKHINYVANHYNLNLKK